jgi:hypothetical protein
MSALKIDLPDGLRSRVEARAAESGFASVESYVQALLVADAAGGPVVDDAQLEAILLSRIDGPFVEADDADFRQMRQKFEAKLGEVPRTNSDDVPPETHR